MHSSMGGHTEVHLSKYEVQICLRVQNTNVDRAFGVRDD